MRERLSLSKSGYKITNERHAIDAAGLSIKLIDELPTGLAHSIKRLNLSNNQIVKLDCMKQFTTLEEINLINNRIKNGRELTVLAELPKLFKIKIEGNPFLQEPLDEGVLELLIEKETDIDILNSEALNKMKDIHEGELKVVFLENYLKKINCHEEIMMKKFGRTQSNRSLLSEESSNRHIINKIMPQFYAIIDDPKINSKLKKEMIGMKRKKQLTLEDAMKERKERQEKQVNNLIKDIFQLVENEDEDENEQDMIMEENDDSKITESDFYQSQQVEMPQKEPVEIPQKELSYSPSLLRNKFRKINEEKQRLSQQNYNNLLETNKKEPNIPVSSIKNTESKQISKIAKTEKKVGEIVEKSEEENKQAVNFYSFNKTQAMPFSKVCGETNKETERGYKQEYQIHVLCEKENLRNDSPEKEFANFNDHAAALNLSIDTNFNFNSIKAPNVPPSPSFNEQYYTHLTKSNPSFALLYSDVGSLSPEEKTVLIEALSKDHKDKTIQLLLQHSKLKKMKELFNENVFNYQKEIKAMTSEIDDFIENEALTKEYINQLEIENERINHLVKGLSTDVKNEKELNWQYKEAALHKDNHIKKLEADIKAKNEQSLYFEQCEQISEQIQEMGAKRRKKEILLRIISRGKQYKKILQWKSEREEKEKIRLLNISWSLMKKHLLVQILAKMKIEEKASSLVKVCFKAWKKETKNEKICQKKEQLLKKYLLKKNFEFIHHQFESRNNNKKEGKLHEFWADQHLLKSEFYKLCGKVKVSKENENIKKSSAEKHYLKTLKNLMFQHLKQSVLSTNSKALSISLKLSYKRKSLFYRNLQKMFQNKLLMQEKESKVELIGKLLEYKIAGKKKLTAIGNLIKESETLKAKTEEVAEIRNYGCKQYFFTQFLNIQQTEKGNYKASKKLQQTLKKMKLKRFLRRAKKYLSIAKKLGELAIKYKQQCAQIDAIENFKIRKVEEKLRGDKIKKVLSNLTKNKYIQRMVDIELNKRVEMEETKQFIDKMKILNDIEMEAIKNEHSKHLQILQQEETQKEIDYRNQILISQNKNLELEDTLKLLKHDLECIREKDFLLNKEKELIREQMVLAEEGKDELKSLNESLLVNNEELQTKYNRLLELYTQAVVEIERKDKTSENYEKDRDKTVEKDKRHIGLVRNGDFVSLRSRMF